MEIFKHGIIVVDPKKSNNESVSVVHFAGYWEEPSENDFIALVNQLRTDKSFGLTEIVDRLKFLPADEDTLEYFNSIIIEEEDVEEN